MKHRPVLPLLILELFPGLVDIDLLVVCIQRFVHDQLALGLFIGRNQFQVKGMWVFFYTCTVRVWLHVSAKPVSVSHLYISFQYMFLSTMSTVLTCILNEIRIIGFFHKVCFHKEWYRYIELCWLFQMAIFLVRP